MVEVVIVIVSNCGCDADAWIIGTAAHSAACRQSLQRVKNCFGCNPGPAPGELTDVRFRTTIC